MIFESLQNIGTRGNFIKLINSIIIGKCFLLAININLNSTDSFILWVNDLALNRETNHIEGFKGNWLRLNWDLDCIRFNLELRLAFTVDSHYLIDTWLDISEMIWTMWASHGCLQEVLWLLSDLAITRVKVDTDIRHGIIVGKYLASDGVTWDEEVILITSKALFPFKHAIHCLCVKGKVVAWDRKDVGVWDGNVFEFNRATLVSLLSREYCSTLGLSSEFNV